MQRRSRPPRNGIEHPCVSRVPEGWAVRTPHNRALTELLRGPDGPCQGVEGASGRRQSGLRDGAADAGTGDLWRSDSRTDHLQLDQGVMLEQAHGHGSAHPCPGQIVIRRECL